MAAPSVSSATSSLASAASDAFSDALDSSSSVASMASDSIASANTDLSSAVSESSSDLLGSSATSASSAASATATKMATDAQGQGMSFLSKFGIFATVLVTILAGLAAAIYFSGYADDIFTYVAKKYYMGKAKAQVTAMGNMGSDKAESFMKGGSSFSFFFILFLLSSSQSPFLITVGTVPPVEDTEVHHRPLSALILFE